MSKGHIPSTDTLVRGALTAKPTVTQLKIMKVDSKTNRILYIEL